MILSLRVASWFEAWVELLAERGEEPDPAFLRFMLHCAVEVVW